MRFGYGKKYIDNNGYFSEINVFLADFKTILRNFDYNQLRV